MKTFNSGPLGRESEFPAQYDASVLHAIARADGRSSLSIKAEQLPFYGEDLWNAYEVSWLNPKGKPVVALLELRVPVSSHSIVESKSLKLYLGSFNATHFESSGDVVLRIREDLSSLLGVSVGVNLLPVDSAPRFELASLPGDCLDDLDVAVEKYEVDSGLLRVKSEQPVQQCFHSHLLRSCCPVTGQPDWASVMIRYHGRELDASSLLKYLISFRSNQEFHEQCVERIFMDIYNLSQPASLTVYARYSRRGGIDINPYRSTEPDLLDNLRLMRQ